MYLAFKLYNEWLLKYPDIEKAYLRKIDDSCVGISGMMCLAFKLYNESLLEYPDIEKAYLREIDDSCVGISGIWINMIIDRVNMPLSFSSIEQFINDNEYDIRSLFVTSVLDLVHHPHKHRHHHGEHAGSAGAHHRGRRNVPSSASRLEFVPINIIKNIWSKVTATHDRPDLGNAPLQYNHAVPKCKYGYLNKKYNTQNQYIKCVPHVWNAINEEYNGDGITCTFSYGQAQIFSNIHQGANIIQDKDYAIGGDSYTNCRPIDFNGRSSMYCEGNHTNFVYTPNSITDSLDQVNAQLMLVRVFRIDRLIGKLVTKAKVLCGFQEPNVDNQAHTSVNTELIEITDQQRDEWQNSIKNIEILLETLSSERSNENMESDPWNRYFLEDCMNEIAELSQRSTVNAETISRLNEQLEWLPKDLQDDIDALSDQRQKVHQVDGQQPYASYSYDHLLYSMSVSHVDDNEYCRNIHQNHLNEQNLISMGNMTNTESVHMFNTWEGYQKVA